MIARTWHGRIHVISFWESMDAVRRSAGDTPDVPVYFPEDDRYLLEREETVLHFDVPVYEGSPG